MHKHNYTKRYSIKILKKTFASFISVKIFFFFNYRKKDTSHLLSFYNCSEKYVLYLYVIFFVDIRFLIIYKQKFIKDFYQKFPIYNSLQYK